MNDSLVESLMVPNQELSQIPEGIETFFPNLRGFQIYDSKLQTISKDVLKFPSLQVLLLSGNELVTLDSDLFAFTPKLAEIWLGSNSLQHVGHNLFAGLNELAYAMFFGNPCINQNAVNRQEVLELNIQLPISCPPISDNSTTTSPTTITTTTTTNSPEYCDKCEWRTVEIVTELVDDQEARIVEHKKEMIEIVAAYETRISEITDSHEARIAELEKQIRELLVNPCAC